MALAAIDLRLDAAFGLGRVSGTAGGIRIVSLLRLALLVMITAQLGRIPILSAGAKEAPILINDLFVVLVIAGAAVTAARRRRLVLDNTAALAILFAAIGAGSALLAVPKFGLTAFELAFSSAYLVRWLAYFGIYLACINFVSRTSLGSIVGTVELAILAFAGFGIFQAIFLPGFAQIVYPEAELYLDWDPQGHRLVSTFLDPNFAGALIAMGLLMLIARLSYGLPVPRWKLILLFAALIATLSRSSVLGFLCGGLVIAVVRGKSRRLWRFVALITALTLPALPFLIQYAITFNKLSIDASALTRVVAWLAAIEVFLDNPILGVGFNTYGFVQSSYGGSIKGQFSFGLDGGILFIGVMTGIVGVIIYSLMYGSVLRRCRRIWADARAQPEERALGLGVAAVSVALLIHSLFLNSLLYPFLMEPLWVLWAMTAIVGSGMGGGTAHTIGGPRPGANGIMAAIPRSA